RPDRRNRAVPAGAERGDDESPGDHSDPRRHRGQRTVRDGGNRAPRKNGSRIVRGGIPAERGCAAARDRVKVSAGSELDRHYPKYWPGRVCVRMTGGEIYSEEVVIPKGERGNPMTAAEVE